MKNQNKFYSTIIHTPLGLMKIEADECCLLSVDFTEDEIGGPENNVSKEGARVIASYFKGEKPAMDLPIAPAPTPFSAKVYKETRKIPYGEVRSYSDIACAMGKPGASRAVGQALNKNRHLILVPCHRVVPKSGGIGGFKEGQEIKKYLLRLEQEGHDE